MKKLFPATGMQEIILLIWASFLTLSNYNFPRHHYNSSLRHPELACPPQKAFGRRV
jgi:hypothetical protein